MSDLRSKLIRLAHADPKVRTALLPLLKEALTGVSPKDLAFARKLWAKAKHSYGTLYQQAFWMGTRVELKSVKGNKGKLRAIEVVMEEVEKELIAGYKLRKVPRRHWDRHGLSTVK